MAKKSFAVFGLGEFGRSVALTMVKNGYEVLAVDRDREPVQEIADYSGVREARSLMLGKKLGKEAENGKK